MKSIDEMKTLDRLRENYVPEKAERLNEEEMQCFRDAKFGMFIHWGLYSLLGKAGECRWGLTLHHPTGRRSS